MDTAKQFQYYTINDIYNLPDGQRAYVLPFMILNMIRLENILFQIK